MNLFEDRIHAGKQLSKHLNGKIDIDTVVIPYPEAYEVAWEVATTFNADVMINLSEFITSSEAPFTPIGAVAEDGTLWLEDALKEELEVPSKHVKICAKIISKNLKDKTTEIEPGRNSNWTEKNVLIVSNKISNGFREMAVAGSLIKEGAKNIHVATPKSSENTTPNLESVVEQIYCLEKPEFLNSSNSNRIENVKI